MGIGKSLQKRCILFGPVTFNRHYVSVTREHSEIEFFQRVRAKISRAFAESLEHSLLTLNTNGRLPAEVTAHLDQYQSLDVPSLIDHHEYNDQTVSLMYLSYNI